MIHVLATAVLTAIPTPDAFDVLPPGYKAIHGKVVIHVTPEVRRIAAVGYRIKQGDSLDRIAQRELGAARRWTAIASLNPELDPRRLRIDTVIWLPPTDEALAPGDAVYLFGRGQLHWPFLPLVPGDDPGDHYGARVVAVPAARLAEYRTMLASKDGKTRDELDAAKWLGTSEGVAKPRTAPVTSPTHSVETEHRITGIDKGVPKLEHVENRYFDEEGKPVDPKAARRSEVLLLALVASAGLIGLAFVAARRRTDEAQLAAPTDAESTAA